MELAVRAGRPRTPPPSYLLTPPPSGGYDDKSCFSDVRDLSRISSLFETPHALPNTLVPSKLQALDENDLLTVPKFSLIKPLPFRFMDLPLAMRHEIYDDVLIVPALISVRQNYTCAQETYLKAGDRDLLPGIASARFLSTVGGMKTGLKSFDNFNVNVLRVSKEIHAEAKAILYGKNIFEIARPSDEMSPAPQFQIRLFPYQNLVANLNIRIHSLYGLDWLIECRYGDFKTYFRGIHKLTLILELEYKKGLGKKWMKVSTEDDEEHVERLRGEMALSVLGPSKARKKKAIPGWLHLRVLFNGEAYIDTSAETSNDGTIMNHEKSVRDELSSALVEAWESFKK